MSAYATPASAARPADAAGTKPCRHCCQPIAAKARVCQHCHNYQTFVGDQRDPRAWLVIIGFFLAIGAAIFVVSTIGGSPAQLTVSEVSSRVVAGSEGPRIFVVGRVGNTASSSGTRIRFRVNVLDDGNRLIDTFLAESPGLIVPANGDATFRLVAATGLSAQEVGRVEVTVDRAGCNG